MNPLALGFHRRWLIGLAVSIACGLGFGSCTKKEDVAGQWKDRIADMEAQMAPPDSQWVQRTGVALGTFSVIAEWSLVTTMPPPEYWDWVSARLEPTFRADKDAGAVRIFRRRLPADIEVLTVKVSRRNTKTNVQAHFSAYPD